MCAAFLRRFLVVCVLASTAAILANLSSPRAQGLPVDLELILAVDCSGSVDEIEAQLQREGYIAALTSERVLNAIRSGENRRIAVAYIEWAGETYQRTIVDWTIIEDAASAKAVTDKVAASPYMAIRWTSISAAIDYSMALFSRSPFEGKRRVIDISGDGKNNNGGNVVTARDRAVAAGVTINGLPILNDRAGGRGFGGGYSGRGFPSDPDLDAYYQNFVIGGPGAFMVPAESFDTFATAIQSKLIREIAGLDHTPSGSQFAATPAGP
jgi:hypothetical protein